MSIPAQARLLDLANLIVAKAANFALTALLFAMIGHGMEPLAFGEFSYWWSMALMIGGVSLGGLSSALVRVVVIHGSVLHLLKPFSHAVQGLMIGAITIALTATVWPDIAQPLMLVSVLTLFGLGVQVQTAALAVLRALEATRENMVASIMLVMFVPLAAYAFVGMQQTMTKVFGGLATAFAVGTLIVLFIARKQFRSLIAASVVSKISSASNFSKNVIAFTLINIFTYGVLNLDFTLFRRLGTHQEFAVMATAKVFFERFALPIMLVFSGAISLRVLRYPENVEGLPARLQFSITPLLIFCAIAAVSILSFGYKIFSSSFRGDVDGIGWINAGCASAGYLLFAINGILFDVLVVRRRVRVVILRMLAFLGLGGVLQTIAIYYFAIAGWAMSWLFFNIAVLVILARDGLLLREKKCPGRIKF